MQVVLKNENERGGSRGTNLMDSILYIKRISRHIERKCVRRLRSWKNRI